MIDATRPVPESRPLEAIGEARFGDVAEADRAPAASVGFADVLSSLVGEVNATQADAAAKTNAFAAGAIDDVHGTMIAVKKAEISLRLVGSIRNKLVDAFQELWRTNV